MASETVDLSLLRAAYYKVRDELLAERMPDGHWVGELSSSALSTATAVSALAVVRNGESRMSKVEGREDLIERGVNWLIQQQNLDGGFGDTDLSHSNIATTYLVVAALHLAGGAVQQAALSARGKRHLASTGGL